MVQLGTKKTALVLYGVLLVLPTVVLGGLHWNQIVVDHDAQIAAVPGGVADAAHRLSEAMSRRLVDLVERENQRPFFHYKKTYFPPGTIGADLAFVPSPLATGPAPRGILAWFSSDLGQRDAAQAELFFGGRETRPQQVAEVERLQASATEIAGQYWKEAFMRKVMRMGTLRSESLALPVAAINLSSEQDVDCLRGEYPALRGLESHEVRIHVLAFHLRFYVEPDGTPRVLASRAVYIESNEHLREMPSCFDTVGQGATFMQGFFVDPTWLFVELPASLSNQVLDVSQEFIPHDSPAMASPISPDTVTIRPVKALALQTFNPKDEDFAAMKIRANTRDLEARFRSQSLHFFGVAAMLILSLSTGMVLLLRSVQRDLESARRTENFVAAVTHELRTPLSAIRLYGEMLQDGWVEDPRKREEYYRRIVRETGRLETLVERVLEKSKITSMEARPELDDLNRIVDGLRPALLGHESAHPATDVEFLLEPDLPPVLLIPESVRSIVTNLVENARKYAPVATDSGAGKQAEPIRVVTRAVGGQVLLEVEDRGPGIQESERSRIFEAFYRVGNEVTRTARGTGLGLHLVALHSQMMQADVEVLAREGGGTVFRVTFKTADPSERGRLAS